MIGAGVLGVCVAARLAEAGAAVTLLEQARPGHAATRSSFAWLNANQKMPRGYHDLNHAGMRAWAALSASLGGAALMHVRPGEHRLGRNVRREQGGKRPARRRAGLTRWGYPARLVDLAEAAVLEPSLRLPPSAREMEVGWFPGEGYLLTGPLVSQLAGRAVQHGATLAAGERWTRDRT